MTEQLTFEQAIAAGQRGMTLASDAAGAEFREQARAFILGNLRVHGSMSSEDIVDMAEHSGIVPPTGEARAWGAPFQSLSRQGRIVSAGTARRRKGHGVRGATIWKLNP